MDVRNAVIHKGTVTRLVITGAMLCLVAGCLATMQIGQDNVWRCFTAKEFTNGHDSKISPIGVSDEFSLDGQVCVFTIFTWPDLHRAGGSHLVEHRWYDSTGLVAKTQVSEAFAHPPFRTMGSIDAGELGLGEHHVEVFIDGNHVATKEFRVRQKSGVKQGKTDAKPVSLYVSAYTLNEVDQPPRILRSAIPLYPFEARNNGVEGRVTLQFVVDKDGRAQEPQVVLGEPEGVFDQSALDVVIMHEFRPAYKNGKPVDCIVKLPIVFTFNR